MAKASRGSSSRISPAVVLGVIFVSLMSASEGAAETPSIDDLVSAVVRINTHINPEGRKIGLSLKAFQEEGGEPAVAEDNA